METAKNPDGAAEIRPPPIEKISVSGTGGRAYDGGEPKPSKNLTCLNLRMDYWSLELSVRPFSGFVVGYEYFAQGDDEYGEFRLHFGLVSVSFLWA
jgi:hypothetical protein